MSDTEKPIHAPAPHKHWNQLGDEKRIRLAGGPPVDPHTLATLTEWQKRGVSYGVLIDRLTALAIDLEFDPVSETPDIWAAAKLCLPKPAKVITTKLPKKKRFVTSRTTR
jgi:hypothetical protein